MSFIQESMGYNIDEAEDNVKDQFNFQLFLEKMVQDEESAFSFLREADLQDKVVYIDIHDDGVPQPVKFKVS